MNFKTVFCLFLINIFFTKCSYLPDEKNFKPNSYEIIETPDYIQLKPLNQRNYLAILFIPGGLVDPHAYIKSFEIFPYSVHLNVIILKVRGNLAILNPKSVDRVTDQFSAFSWVIGGHSLGGVLAAKCVKDKPSKYKALFFQGSYSTDNISNYSGPVLSVRGSEDGLTSQNDWDKYAKNLPEGLSFNDVNKIPYDPSNNKTIYLTIEGGNHAQFGNYGVQKKDGTALISPSKQQSTFVEALTHILKINGINN